LVAGRIKDRLHRPVVAFAPAEDGSLRGSARSVAGINIRDALDSIAVRHPGLVRASAATRWRRDCRWRNRETWRCFRAAFAAEIARRADPDSLPAGS
jgi:single-stranded-DNA-specific exonuclease